MRDVAVFVRYLAMSLMLVVLAFGSISASAVAATGSAIDQYEENIPSGAGGGNSKGSDGRGSAKPLGPKESKSLSKHGADGKRLEQVLRNTAASPNAGPAAADQGERPTSGQSDDDGAESVGRATSASGAGAATAPQPAGPGAGPPGDGTTRSAVSAGLASDLGPVPLWVALVAILAAAAVIAVVRRVKT